MRNRYMVRGLSAAIAAVLLLSAACTGDDDQAPNAGTQSSHAVEIRQFVYSPVELQIDAGEAVEWTNDDEILHTVTAGTPAEPGDSFDGQLAGAGQQFRFVFDAPGVYSYFCTRHTFMTGVVHVAE